MQLNEYQTEALKTADYPNINITGAIHCNIGSAIYPIIGLAGEVGEVSEKVKKIIRDKYGEASPEDLQKIKAELGDVLWYIAVLADRLGFNLEDVAIGNIAKLQSRKERNVIHGEGDVR